MTDKFTLAELQLATFKASMENNAMLRILLGNQVKIMQKLDIDLDLFDGIYSDLSPDGKSDPLDGLSVLIQTAGTISIMLQKRAWEWVKMNTTEILDSDDNNDED